jgi:hypothetical protein
MKENYKETMSLKALADKILAGNQVGNHEETSLKEEETSGQKFPKKFPNSVTRFCLNEYCQGCPYHDTGQTQGGKGVIRWCGPWKEPGSTRWLNIAELTACPLGKCGMLKF